MPLYFNIKSTEEHTTDRTGNNEIEINCNQFEVQNTGETDLFFGGYFIGAKKAKIFHAEVLDRVIVIYKFKAAINFDTGAGKVRVIQANYKTS